jgi:pilus assembly protein CpaD
MTKRSLILMTSGLLTLAACADPTPHPDYAIRVIPTASGGVAIPPACPSWSTSVSNPLDNQPVPQFGCATARNLAAMVERPNDLIQGRTMGDARGVTAVGAVRRYDNDQTRGLIIPGTEVNQPAVTTSSSGTSSLTGDITGGAGTSAATSSSSSSTSSP